MCDTTGHTDTDQTEAGMFFQKLHHSQAKRSASQTIQNTEQISKHKSDHQDSDNGHESRFFKGISVQYKKHRQVCKPELDTRNPCKYRDQRLHISKNDRYCGK